MSELSIAFWVLVYTLVSVIVYLGLMFTWFNAEERRTPFPHGWSFFLTLILPFGILFLTLAVFSKGMSALWRLNDE